MTDLKNPTVIVMKGALFFLTGLLAAGELIVESPSIQTAILIAITAWCFARFYYFAFYVLEHYVDPHYRYSGLGSMLRFACTKRAK